MQWIAIACALCGCNQVFSLRETQPIDAIPIDAPPSCPAPGTGGVPRFSRVLRQAIFQACSYYTRSTTADLAMATCPLVSRSETFEGTANATELTLASVVPKYGTITEPRLSPDGRLFAREPLSTFPNPAMYSVYTRNGTDAWTWSADVVTGTLTSSLGTPSRAPSSHVLLAEPITQTLHELVEDDAGVWHEVTTQAYSTLTGSTRIDNPNLSEDGLRLTFTILNLRATAYADRPSIGSPFGTATVLDDVPPASDAFLTEDCGRLYFSGLDSVFYAPQL